VHTAIGVAERGAWDAALAATRALSDEWGIAGVASYAAGRGTRAHSFSRRIAASAAVQRSLDARRTRVAIQYSRLEDEDPGAIDQATADANPSRANDAFDADERTRDAAELSGIFDRPLGASQMLRLSGRIHGARQGRTRTLLLTPSLGDTQFHHETDQGFWIRAQHDLLGATSRLVSGVEVGDAEYESSYRDPETSEELSSSSGNRLALALYSEMQRELAARLRAYAGARFDRVTPSASLAFRDEEATFSAWSGRVGINYAYRDGDLDGGNVFIAGSTGFKTPTLDQLYDARRTRLPDGNTISIANPELQPQRSREIEAGIFQRVPMGRSSLEISLSAYLRNVEDEIDFDLATFRYGNIKRSRHESVEVLTLAHLGRDIEVRNALTLGRSTFRTGPYEGNQLKNIPRVSSQTALAVPLLRDVTLTLAHRATSKSWIDDENTTALPGIDLFDAGLRVVAGMVKGSVRIENLSNERGAMLGFLLFDPNEGRNVAMVYPLGGRTVRVSIEVDR
jgi:hypothetical protein